MIYEPITITTPEIAEIVRTLIQPTGWQIRLNGRYDSEVVYNSYWNRFEVSLIDPIYPNDFHHGREHYQFQPNMTAQDVTDKITAQLPRLIRAKHNNAVYRKIGLIKQRSRDRMNALPRITADQARPGDILIDVTHSAYFEVYSLSAGKAKIMVNDICSYYGPMPLRRLTKKQIQTTTVVMPLPMFNRALRMGRVIEYQYAKLKHE